MHQKIYPGMDLEWLVNLVHKLGAPVYEGDYADAQFLLHVIEFRDRLVMAAEKNGWDDVADVPDEAWDSLQWG